MNHDPNRGLRPEQLLACLAVATIAVGLGAWVSGKADEAETYDMSAIWRMTQDRVDEVTAAVADCGRRSTCNEDDLSLSPLEMMPLDPTFQADFSEWNSAISSALEGDASEGAEAIATIAASDLPQRLADDARRAVENERSRVDEVKRRHTTYQAVAWALFGLALVLFGTGVTSELRRRRERPTVDEFAS